MAATENKLPQVIQDCDAVLEAFAKHIASEYNEGKENFATAKKMYQDVKYHIDHNMAELQKKACKVEDAQRDLQDLMKKQDPLWEQFSAKAEAQKARVEQEYAKVKEAEEAVNQARGVNNPFNRAWGTFPTEDQEMIRKYYTHKLVPSLKEAKARSEEFVGFPDGFCTRVRLLKKQAHEQTNKAIDEMKSKA